MRATVLSISSPDVDMGQYRPGDLSDDGVAVTMNVGPSDGPGSESFDLMVCTPRWLERRLQSIGGPIVGRHYLILEEMNLQLADAFLRQHVSSLEAPTWSELAAKIGRLGHWEFEDFRP